MWVRGSCHCKATQFEISHPPSSLVRCTCSFCSKRGVLWAYYDPEQFALKTSRDRVSTYQWRSFTNDHHHCAICGCGTYTESPKWVDGQADYSRRQIGINARLLDDVDIESLSVTVIDGKNLW